MTHLFPFPFAGACAGLLFLAGSSLAQSTSLPPTSQAGPWVPAAAAPGGPRTAAAGVTNLVVNGDFEGSTAMGCESNLPNAQFDMRMPGAHAFGGAEELDIYLDPFGCFGLPGNVGPTKVALHNVNTVDIDAFTLQLSAPLVPGQRYRLEFWLQYPDVFTPVFGTLNVGVASASNDFGSTVASASTQALNQWFRHEVTFAAPSAAGFLSIYETSFDAWVHVDGFCLEEIDDDPGPGVNYCIGGMNSTGIPARVTTFGSAVVSNNDLGLAVSGSLPNGLGLFFYGPTPLMTAFGDGFRCIGGTTKRLFPALVADNNGAAQLLLDQTAPPLVMDAIPGDTLHFQWWYRDPLGPGSTGFNLSDATRVVLQ